MDGYIYILYILIARVHFRKETISSTVVRFDIDVKMGTQKGTFACYLRKKKERNLENQQKLTENYLLAKFHYYY